MILGTNVDRALGPVEGHALHRRLQSVCRSVSAGRLEGSDHHQRCVHAVRIEQVGRSAEHGLVLSDKEVVRSVVRRRVVIQDDGRGTDRVREERRHQDVVDEGRTQDRLLVDDPEVDRRLIQRNESTAGPCHEECVGAAVRNRLEIRREVCRVRRGEDVIVDELAAEVGACILVRLCAAIPEGVVRCDLHERLVPVVVDELIAQGDRILVVASACTERIGIEILARDVRRRGRRRNQDHVVFGSQALQGRRDARRHRTNQDLGAVDLNQLAGSRGTELWIRLVVLVNHIDLAVVQHERLLHGVGSARHLTASAVGEPNGDTSHHVRSVDRERPGDVGNHPDDDRLVTTHSGHCLGRRCHRLGRRCHRLGRRCHRLRGGCGGCRARRTRATGCEHQHQCHEQRYPCVFPHSPPPFPLLPMCAWNISLNSSGFSMNGTCPQSAITCSSYEPPAAAYRSSILRIWPSIGCGG